MTTTSSFTPTTPPVVVTIAGSDSGGAAGIAADLTTFAAHAVHGACVVTAVTAQDTTGVRAIHPVPQGVLDAQLDAVLEDLPVAAAKTGMLGAAEAVLRISKRIVDLIDTRPHLVVDPVLVATSGTVLGDHDVCDAYVSHLLPVATATTPNLDEARALAAVAGLDPDRPADELAVALTEICPIVIITGGDESHASTGAVDWIAVRGEQPVALRHQAITTANDHGTGCTFSAALAARFAHGDSPTDAAMRAASYVSGQLRLSSTWELGRGRGPIAHLNTNQGVDR